MRYRQHITYHCNFIKKRPKTISGMEDLYDKNANQEPMVVGTMQQHDASKEVEVLLMFLSCSNTENTFGVCVMMRKYSTLKYLRDKVMEEFSKDKIDDDPKSSVPKSWAFLREGKYPICQDQEESIQVLNLNHGVFNIHQRRVSLYAQRTEPEKDIIVAAPYLVPQNFDKIIRLPFLPSVPEELPLLPEASQHKGTNLWHSDLIHQKENYVPPLPEVSTIDRPKETKPSLIVARKSIPLSSTQHNTTATGASTTATMEDSTTKSSSSSFYGWTIRPADAVQPSSCRLNSAAQCILARMRSSKDVWR